MVLSPGHRKQLTKALDLMAHKNPKNAQQMRSLLKTAQSVRHGWQRPDNKSAEIYIYGTMRQSSKNRLPSRINSDSDTDSDSNGNGNGNRTTAAMKQRVFKWSVSYDTNTGKYIVLKDSDEWAKANTAGHHRPRQVLVGLMTKDQLLRRIDDKRLVEVEAPKAGIYKTKRPNWHANRNAVAKAIKTAHADLTKRQNHLANLLRAVGARRERARRGHAVLQHDQFRPGSSAFHAASKRFHADSAAGQPAKRQKQ
jgi:hypothetical protein